jgi:hypothetical protein
MKKSEQVGITILRNELEAFERAVELGKTKQAEITEVDTLVRSRLKVWLFVQAPADLFAIGEMFAVQKALKNES